MRLTAYEKDVRKQIEKWEAGSGSFFFKAINWAMQPMDWFVSRVISPDMEEQADAAVNQLLSILNDASRWTQDFGSILDSARRRGLEVEAIEDLRNEDLEVLDAIAREQFSLSSVIAAIEGIGTGLGGVVLIAADIPLLFTINLRMIQHIAASYGFRLDDESYKPLILSVFNVASSGSSEAKVDAIREISVAAAAFANDLDYRGRVRGSFRDQNRHLPREIVKNVLGRKLAQMIPIAGAAVGGGINYWFTNECANTAHMLFRALYLERKDRL